MEEIARYLHKVGFSEAAARDLAKQGHQRHYLPHSIVWNKQVLVSSLILPLNGDGMVSGEQPWNATWAIRAVVGPEMLQFDLVCQNHPVSAFLIARSQLVLAARYYPDIFLLGLEPFAGTE